MFWNDIADIKSSLRGVDMRLDAIEMQIGDMNVKSIPQSFLDNFEKSMENFEKLNTMINEVNGCIAMARAVLSEKKSRKTCKKRPKRVVSPALAP